MSEILDCILNSVTYLLYMCVSSEGLLPYQTGEQSDDETDADADAEHGDDDSEQGDKPSSDIRGSRKSTRLQTASGGTSASSSEAAYHSAIVSLLRKPGGYEAVGLEGPATTIEHATLAEWAASFKPCALNASNADVLTDARAAPAK
jgi:hypothetical protein